MPSLDGVLETALYVDDMARARRFYEEILGLAPIFADARLTAYPVGGRSALLLFLRGSTSRPCTCPAAPSRRTTERVPCTSRSRSAPPTCPHGSSPSPPMAFDRGAHPWPRGSISIYFRDPDGHLMELATPGLWTIY